ncbi:unnamed protein product, partial [Prorocentrum cordatum]
RSPSDPSTWRRTWAKTKHTRPCRSQQSPRCAWPGRAERECARCARGGGDAFSCRRGRMAS